MATQRSLFSNLPDGRMPAHNRHACLWAVRGERSRAGRLPQVGRVFCHQRVVGEWSWCIAHSTAFIAPATALAVGPFVGQGCECSELPCLGRGDKELGRRSWSFLRLWCLLSGIMGEPSALPMDFEACGGMSCKGDRMAMVAADCPLMAGGQARMPAPEAFLRVLKPAASPLRNPRSCRRMTGGGAPTIHPSTLVFYPLVTPLRRDDQGLSSDEAAGFTSCAACDRHFLISNWFIGA